MQRNVSSIIILIIQSQVAKDTADILNESDYPQGRDYRSLQLWCFLSSGSCVHNRMSTQ